MIDGSPALLVVYLLGVTGIILSLGDIFGLSVQNYFLLLGTTIVLNMIFWYLYTHRSRAFIYMTAIITVSAGLIIIPQVYSVSSRIKYLVVHNRPLNALTLDPLFLMTLLVLLTFFLFSLEFVMRSHTLMFAGGIVLIILVPVFGHNMTLLNTLLLLAFEVGFAAVNMSERRSIKHVMKMPKRAHINVMSMLLAFALIALCLIPSFIAERSAENSFFEFSYYTDNFIKEIVSKIMRSNLSGDLNGGNINRGNLYQSGADQLALLVDKVPSSTLYVKGFVGKDYSDSNWSNAFLYTHNDENGASYLAEPFMPDVFSNAVDMYKKNTNEGLPYPYYYLYSDLSDPISETYYLGAGSTLINHDYYSIVTIDGTKYLQVNNDEEANGYLLNPDANNITFLSLSGATRGTIFVPYYAKLSHGRSYNSSGSSRSGYTNSFLTADQIKNPDTPDDTVSIYDCIKQEYRARLQSQYTDYPTDTFSRLKQLCLDTPLSDLNSITTYILVTLQNKAVYTTTPGSTPYNKDVIDYFLFENGKGYCVHFASAAALMYRMYGIPARYVTGYVAQPSDFTPSRFSEDKYSAVLTDYSAHAWVEIFLPDYGWVPVEVTPASDGLMHAEYPGYSETVMRHIMDLNGWKFSNEAADEDAGGDEDGGAGGAASGVMTVITIIPFAVAAAFVVFLVIRRRRMLRKLPQTDCITLFGRIMRMLHKSKLLTDYTGSEKDFPLKLCECVDSLTEEECRKLLDIVLKANYSENGVEPEEREFTEQCYRQIAKELYGKTPLIKKPIFRFLYGFI